MKISKKGLYSVSSIGALALMLGITTIIIAVSANVQDSIQNNLDTESRTAHWNLTLVNNSWNNLNSHVLPCSEISNSSFSLSFYDAGGAGTMNASDYNLNVANGSVFIHVETKTGSLVSVLSGLQPNFTYTEYCTTAYNATENGLESNETFANWLPTISLILAAAIVIGVLMTSFKAE